VRNEREKNMRKLILIALALVLAMGALGVGYASWTDKVTVGGPVTTGSVCAKWTTVTSQDGPTGPPPWVVGVGNGDPNLDVTAITDNPNGWPTYTVLYKTDKNVASTVITGMFTNTVTITVNNAYPLYMNDMEVEFTNCGTIPVTLESIVITPLNFTLADQPWADATHPSNGGQIWVRVANGIGTQLEPGDIKAASVKFVVQQSAAQNAGAVGGPPAYQFTITWKVIQWNEYEPVVHGPV
jgi:predicted ribosomally synthesized peptide with SipW-like signal peptide